MKRFLSAASFAATLFACSGGGTPMSDASGPITIVGNWHGHFNNSDGSVVDATDVFSGTDSGGTFANVLVQTLFPMMPGCVGTYRFTGTYTLGGGMLSSMVSQGTSETTGCATASMNQPQMPIPMTSFDSLVYSTNGPVTLTGTTLTVTTSMGPAVFTR